MDNLNKSGAVRSADVDMFSYTSLPMLGLIGVARTAAEGQQKYGRLNYKQGLPVHQYLEHAIHHIVLDIAGDRSQPNLEHAAWGILAAIESRLLHPDLNTPYELGPGSTITPEIKAELERTAPGLAADRKAGKFKDVGSWRLADLPDVKKILDTRAVEEVRRKLFSDVDLDPLTLEMVDFLKDGNQYCSAHITEFCQCNKCSTDVMTPADDYAVFLRTGESPCREPAGLPCLCSKCEAKSTDTPVVTTEFVEAANIENGETLAVQYTTEYGSDDVARQPVRYWPPDSDEHKALAKMGTGAKLEESEAEALTKLLEKRLGVTPEDMAKFEAEKLSPLTDDERTRLCRVPALTDAVKVEAMLAAGWEVPDRPGLIETHRFRRETNGGMTLIGHETEFPDGSVLDRMSERAVPARPKQDECAARADLAHADWAEERAKANAYHAENRARVEERLANPFS